MILTSISLDHFRSYTKRTFEFSPETTLILGPNTAGKTNILEAIAVCATGKSFRADSDKEMITWGCELCVVSCVLYDETTLEFKITQGEVAGQKTPVKKYLVNGVPRRQIDFVGNLRVVLFWPQDLELVTDSPSLRRRYLDSVLVQVDREYRRNLYSYERGLRQRNRLLDSINEGSATRSQLLFWDQLLIKAGGYITDKRGEYIHFMNQCRMPNPPAGKAGAECRIEYDKSVISESRLEQYAEEEVAAKATLVGPHRDDFVFTKYNIYNNYKTYNDYRELSKYGSRGEQRLAVLWLKLAELAYIHEKTGDRPVLLLDDIFSELDEDHRRLVVDVIGNQQTILTSADSSTIPEELSKKISIIRL